MPAAVSFLTFPALLAAGLGVRAANITSTVALFPGQIVTGWAGRQHVAGLPGLSVRALAGISLLGGALGALLLLNTSEAVFQRLVPFLVLFATTVFAWVVLCAGRWRRWRICRWPGRPRCSSPSPFTAAISAAGSAF
ncbi:MAG: TSUP family transporter [Rhodospirillales bacterium]